MREQERRTGRDRDYYRDGYPDMIEGVTCVMVTEADYKRLPTYDCSVPTGVYVGKVWKRRDAGGVWLGAYEDHEPPRDDSVRQTFRPLKVLSGSVKP